MHKTLLIVAFQNWSHWLQKPNRYGMMEILIMERIQNGRNAMRFIVWRLALLLINTLILSMM